MRLAGQKREAAKRLAGQKTRSEARRSEHGELLPPEPAAPPPEPAAPPPQQPTPSIFNLFGLVSNFGQTSSELEPPTRSMSAPDAEKENARATGSSSAAPADMGSLLSSSSRRRRLRPSVRAPADREGSDKGSEAKSESTPTVTSLGSSKGASAAIPVGWRRYASRDGRPYFFNPETNQTQWEPPVLRYEATGDDGEPYFYYYDPITRKTSWEPPVGVAGWQSAELSSTAKEARRQARERRDAAGRENWPNVGDDSTVDDSRTTPSTNTVPSLGGKQTSRVGGASGAGPSRLARGGGARPRGESQAAAHAEDAAAHAHVARAARPATRPLA